MKATIALFAVVMTMSAAANAAAQEPPEVVYQNSLLARPLTSPDKEFCDGIAGEAKSVERDRCHITRQFIADLNAGRKNEVPPKLNIRYARDKAEKLKIMDAL